MRLVIVLIVLLAWASPALAQETHYVRDGGSCTNNCHAWNNAYDQITTLFSAGDLSRGDTVYVADGSYNGFTFALANSGTTLVTFLKCTAADHGTETGYSASDCNGQAVFGSFWIQTGYTAWDGQAGGGFADPDCALCGFSFQGEHVFGQDCCTPPGSNPPDGHIMRHVDMDGLNDNSGDSGRTLELWFTDDLLIEYAYIHDSKCDLLEVTGVNDIIIQHSQLARDHQIICHGDIAEHQIADSTNITFRWNYFEDAVGSYGFGSHGPNINGYHIYGNIFYWPNVDPVFGNHLVGTLDGSGAVISNMKFLNNSLYGNFREDDKGTPQSDDDDLTNVCIGNLGGGSGNEVRNNLWVSNHGSGTSVDYDCGVGGATASTNTGYQINGLNQELSGNPFTNVGALDFSLVSDSTAGTDTESTIPDSAVDMFGNRYDANGGWTRGAVAFDDGEGDPVDITTTSLPNATQGQAYSQTISATDGTAPYTFGNNGAGTSLNDGDAQCAGLSIATDGDITGTPTETGVCSFIVDVEDDAMGTDTQGLTITIDAAGSPTLDRRVPFIRFE